MIASGSKSLCRTLIATALAFAAAASALPAQFVGGNPGGAMVLSPLDGEKKTSAPKSAKERAAERRSLARMKKLDPIKRRLDEGKKAADNATTTRAISRKILRLRKAIQRASRANRDLDRMRKLYAKDRTFMIQANTLGFRARKELSQYKREMKRAEASKRRLDAARKPAIVPKESAAPEKRATATKPTPTSKPSSKSRRPKTTEAPKPSSRPSHR